MKITKKQLRQIITEELDQLMAEADTDPEWTLRNYADLRSDQHYGRPADKRRSAMDYATAAADAPGHLVGAPVRSGPRGYEGMAPGAGGSLGTGPGLGRGTSSGPRQRYARAPNGAPNHTADKTKTAAEAAAAQAAPSAFKTTRAAQRIREVEEETPKDIKKAARKNVRMAKAHRTAQNLNVKAAEIETGQKVGKATSSIGDPANFKKMMRKANRTKP